MPALARDQKFPPAPGRSEVAITSVSEQSARSGASSCEGALPFRSEVQLLIGALSPARRLELDERNPFPVSHLPTSMGPRNGACVLEDSGCEPPYSVTARGARSSALLVAPPLAKGRTYVQPSP